MSDSNQSDSTNKTIPVPLAMPKEPVKTKNGKITLSDLSILKSGKYLVFDVEWTTGTQIVYEISWMTMKDDQVIEKCCPDLVITQKQETFLTKLTHDEEQQLVTNKLKVKDQLLRAIENCETLISHNLSADLSMLERNDYINIQNIINQGKNFFCTMFGTKTLVGANNKYGEIKNPSLKDLYKYLFGNEIPNESELHNAFYDTQILCECVNYLMVKILPELPEKLAESITKFSEKTHESRPSFSKRSENSGQILITFGKHAGKTFQWVKSNDRDYCCWVLKLDGVKNNNMKRLVKFLQHSSSVRENELYKKDSTLNTVK
jgi:hypothetical protein